MPRSNSNPLEPEGVGQPGAFGVFGFTKERLLGDLRR